MTAYYLAAPFHTLQSMRIRRNMVLDRIHGSTVTSRWLDQEPYEEENLTSARMNAHPELGEAYAVDDLADLDASDVLVMVTLASGGRGGRHTEYGYWLALSRFGPKPRRTVIIGDRENVFQCLGDIERFDTFDGFLDHETATVPQP